MGKRWENVETMGKPYENQGKIRTPGENYRNTTVKWRFWGTLWKTDDITDDIDDRYDRILHIDDMNGIYYNMWIEIAKPRP